jgi:hypothetical protein
METVEKQLGAAVGSAVTKLTARINMVLGKRSDAEGRTFKGMHDTLIQVSKQTRNAFADIGKNVFKTPKLHSSIRATDVRHLLLLLPLICHDLFSSEVAQYNEQNRGRGPPRPKRLSWFALSSSNGIICIAVTTGMTRKIWLS